MQPWCALSPCWRAAIRPLPTPVPVSMEPSRVSPILQLMIWAPATRDGPERIPVAQQPATNNRSVSGSVKGDGRMQNAVRLIQTHCPRTRLGRGLSTALHISTVRNTAFTDVEAQHACHPPGAMPLLPGSSGKCAAVMPATCVPCAPQSTTTDSRRPPSRMLSTKLQLSSSLRGVTQGYQEGSG